MYLCYVDEAGNLDCNLKEPCADTRAKAPIFVLTGLCVLDHKWPKFSGPIDRRKESLRQQIFHTKGISLDFAGSELKSSWIRQPSLRARNPFLANLSPDELRGLVNLCYQQIGLAKMTIFAVIVDKRKLFGHYDSAKLHHVAWELLIERVENFLRERHDKHKVILIRDDISVQVNHKLAEKHALLLASQASSGLKLDHIVEMPMFARSELSNGIQLADLIAYNFYHAFAYNKPNYEYLRRILGFVYNSANTAPSKLDGMKLFPPDSELKAIADQIEKASLEASVGG
jgi:hypothetical protein